jgi:hypothetical protein
MAAATSRVPWYSIMPCITGERRLLRYKGELRLCTFNRLQLDCMYHQLSLIELEPYAQSETFVEVRTPHPSLDLPYACDTYRPPVWYL